MSNIPRLYVRSLPFCIPVSFSDLLAEITENSLVWAHSGSFLLGFGTAARYDIANFAAASDCNAEQINISKQQSRFLRANDWWVQLRNFAQINDQVGYPGSGLFAFGSFSFSADSPAGSLLRVPRLLVGFVAGQAWLTQIWVMGESEPDFPASVLDLYASMRRLNHDGETSALAKFVPAVENSGFSHCTNLARKQAAFVASKSMTGVPDRKNTNSTANTLLHIPFPSPEDWMNSVAKAITLIHGGELEKVVLSRRLDLTFPKPVSVSNLLQDLTGDYPDTWVFSIDGLIGASPEMLAESDFQNYRKNLVHCRVLAGSMPIHLLHSKNASTVAAKTPISSRSEKSKVAAESTNEITVSNCSDSQQQLNLPLALTESVKDLREHELAVNSALRVLRSFGQTQASNAYVLNLPNVAHLATDIYTVLHTSHSLLEVINCLHPTAALGGTPTDKALTLIKQLEIADRDRYGAPIGWLSYGSAGTFEQWAIALRCCKITPDRMHVKAWAGSGIMPDSLPHAELNETTAKLRPILNTLEKQFASENS